MSANNDINQSMIKLFEKSGNVKDQSNLLKMLNDLFTKTTLDEFNKVYLGALMSVIVADGTIHCAYINNMIKFGARALSLISERSSKDNQNGLYVISQFFKSGRTLAINTNRVIRWRFCHFFNHLMGYMDEESLLTVELCDVVSIILLKRLNDKKPEIRTQAAHALHRLQSSNNSSCKIVEQFLFHMTCDPSDDVRAAIVKRIALFHNVIDEILKSSLRDISDNVRKEAYNRLLEISFLSLSAKQRITVLERGLKDENKIINLFVKEQLLDHWKSECGYNFVTLLENLGVENEFICETVLNSMFEYYYDEQILSMINDILNSETRMINFKQLTVEKIFLWKCIAKYLTKEKKINLAQNRRNNNDDFFDVLLPNLVQFSDYVRKYYFEFNTECDKVFILTQLLDMAKTFEMDEYGLESLNKLCFDLILHPEMSIKPIKPIVVLLNLTLKTGVNILNYVKRVLNEIQTETFSFIPIITKVGKKELLEHKIAAIQMKIEKLCNTDGVAETDSTSLNDLLTEKQMYENECQESTLTQKELQQANLATTKLLNGFELIFRVQQSTIILHERSLLTDIIQNFVVGYLDCQKTDLRMVAFRSLTSHMLTNSSAVTQEHVSLLCGELTNPLSNKHLILEIMFELLLRWGVKMCGMNEDLDIEEDGKELDKFSVTYVLSLLVDCIDYEINDHSFKTAVVQGFCNLLIYKKIKSIKLISKLLILWFRNSTHESFNIRTTLTKCFTSFVFYFRSSSSTLAKCYVPALKEVDENDLATKLNFKVDELNTTLINLTAGIAYNDEKTFLNAHDELAGYILDYLLDDPPYTNMLIDTLSKLDINYDANNDLIDLLRPKLLKVIKHFKTMESKKNVSKYLKKLKNKFDPVLKKKAKKIEVDSTVDDNPQVPSCSYQEFNRTVQTNNDPSQEDPLTSNDRVEVVGDLFTQENIHELFSSDDEDGAHPQLEAIKRMSEMFKRSYNTTMGDVSSTISSD